jgi:general secretion pathway protein A
MEEVSPYRKTCPYNHAVQPPASLKALSDPIYEAFYGLTEQPFAITTDPRFFYLSASHQRAFSELLNGLRRREGLMLLTGETGTGKTTLCRAVIDALGERTFAAMILNPYMSGAEVLRIVLRDFGLVSHEDLRRGGLASADVPQLLDTLEGFLRSLAPLGSHAVIVLDEAQSVPAQTLDQIRLLTALEHQGRRLVQIVLCGQSGLLSMLKTDGLSALNERITRRVEVGPLPADQVAGYIQHRLGVAGGAEAVAFDAAASRAVADLSRGVPRRINVLCDRALQEGRIEGVSTITPDLVKRAARAVAGVHDPLPVLPTPPPTPVLPPRAAEPSPAARPFAPPASPISSYATPPARPAAAGADRIAAAAAPTAGAEVVAAAPVSEAGRATAPFYGADAAEGDAGLSDRDQMAAVAEPDPEPSTPGTDGPELTFGQTAEVPSARRGRLVAWVAAALAMAGALGYAFYAQSVPDPVTVLPADPPPAVNTAWPPAGALPVPTPEEIATIDELFPPARRGDGLALDPAAAGTQGVPFSSEGVPVEGAPTAPAEFPVPPEPTQTAPAPAPSPQIPEDGNQVN